MSSTDYKFPTLGQFSKVLCDCLGLWASDGKTVEFHVPASEKARRDALRHAFDSIKKENGAYGSLDELISVTTQVAPEPRHEFKKNATIQSHVLHLAKEDYASHEELIELAGYIEIIAREKYKHWGVSELAVKLYSSALLHYKELIREYSTSPEGCMTAYQGFLAGTMIDLARALANVEPRTSNHISRWPLREFVENACITAEVSPYRLHQFHNLRKKQENRKLKDKELWSLDFKSKPVSTQSKQLFERMSKGVKIKWEAAYPFIRPLYLLISTKVDEQEFASKFFCAFISHNLYMHASEIGGFDPNTQPHYPRTPNLDASIPISDCIDNLLHDDDINEKSVNLALTAYHDLLKILRSEGRFLAADISMPGVFEMLYRKEHLKYFSSEWHKPLTSTPEWIHDWELAKDSMLTGSSESALQHFKRAFEKAKYSAGPLFFPFYIQVCAFCKSQYRRMSSIGEVEIFERFYEPLGSAASKYADLLGYTPGSTRDTATLLPKSNLIIKNTLIIQEIDLLEKMLSNAKSL